MKPYTPRAFAGALALSVLFGAGSALADAKATADAFVAAVTAAVPKASVTYEGATESGDQVTITNFKMVNTEGEQSITLPSIVIVGAADRQPGGFTASEMRFDGGTMTGEDGLTMTWQTGVASGATVLSADEIKAKPHNFTPASKVDIAGIQFKSDDMPAPVDIASVAMAFGSDAEGKPNDFQLDIGSIKISPAFFADQAEAAAMLQALGYDGFTINVGVGGGYDTATDTLTVRGVTIDTVDAGKLTITGQFIGVPLSKLGDDAATNELVANGKLAGLSIRFDNSGIVDRVIDMNAKQMGVSADDYKQQIIGVIPLGLNMVPNAGLQEKLATAAKAFLEDPKSITIAAQPPAPVAFAEIAGAAAAGMQDLFAKLPDMLSVNVTAND